MLARPYIAAAAIFAATGTAAGIAVAAHFAFFLMPFAWTGEPARLVALLGIHPGDRVADIGAETDRMQWPSPASLAGREKCWPPTLIPAAARRSPTARHERTSTCV